MRIGHRTGGRRAEQRFAPLALEVEHGLVDRDRAADHRLVAAGLLVLAEEVHGVGAAQHDQQRVDVGRQLGDHRGVVLAAERHPRLVRDLAAELAVAGHEALHLRVREGVVLGDQRHLLVLLVVQRVVAEPDHPLRAFGVEAEEVGRRVDQRRGLRARRAVDEGDAGLGLGVVLDRDAFGARQRADHDLDLVLLDQLAGGVDRHVGLGVGRGLDDLDLLAAGHAVAFLHGELGAAHAVLAAGRERAFERGQQADLHGFLRLGGRREHGRDRRPRQQPD